MGLPKMMVPVFAGTDSPEQIAQLIHYHAPSKVIVMDTHLMYLVTKQRWCQTSRTLLALVHVHQVTQGRRAKFNQFFALSRLIALVVDTQPR
jgi:hypothetical protein